MLRFRIEARADIDFLGVVGDAFDDLVEDRLLDVETAIRRSNTGRD